MGRRLSVFALVALVGILGCAGSATNTVSGKVSVEGKPVYSGAINLMAANGEIYPGGIDYDGSYVVMNVPSGVMKVGVISDKPSETPLQAIKVDPANPNAQPAPRPVTPSKWVAVDAKYADPKTSPKEITVKSGKNEIDIDLD